MIWVSWLCFSGTSSPSAFFTLDEPGFSPLFLLIWLRLSYCITLFLTPPSPIIGSFLSFLLLLPRQLHWFPIVACVFLGREQKLLWVAGCVFIHCRALKSQELILFIDVEYRASMSAQRLGDRSVLFVSRSCRCVCVCRPCAALCTHNKTHYGQHKFQICLKLSVKFTDFSRFFWRCIWGKGKGNSLITKLSAIFVQLLYLTFYTSFDVKAFLTALIFYLRMKTVHEEPFLGETGNKEQ